MDYPEVRKRELKEMIAREYALLERYDYVRGHSRNLGEVAHAEREIDRLRALIINFQNDYRMLSGLPPYTETSTMTSSEPSREIKILFFGGQPTANKLT